MRKIIIHPFIMALPLFCGCAALQRPLTDAAFGAGGAFLGDKFSGGNPAVIAGSAGAGVLLGEGIQAWKSSSEKTAYTNGYTQGRSDGVKGRYWNLQDQQRTQEGSASYRLIEVTIPEHWEDGVLLKPTKRIIRIQE